MLYYILRYNLVFLPKVKNIPIKNEKTKEKRMAAKKKNEITQAKTRDEAFEKEAEKKKARRREEDEPETKKLEKKREVRENREKTEKNETPEKKLAPPSSRLLHQFLPFIFIVLAILIAVCLIVVELADKDMGVIGSLISHALCGLFGIGAFFIPIIIVCLGINWHKIIDAYRTTSNIVFAVISMVMISSVIHVFYTGDVANFSVTSLWEIGIKPGGGGVVGGFICELLVHWFNQLGATIITVALLIVSLMFLFRLTPKSIVIFCKYKAKLAKERRAMVLAEEKERRAAEEAELEQMEKEKRAEEIRQRAKAAAAEKSASVKKVQAVEPEEETPCIPSEPEQKATVIVTETKRTPAEDPMIAINSHLKNREIPEENTKAPEEFHEDDDGVQIHKIFSDNTKKQKKEEGTIISVDLPAAGTAKKSIANSAKPADEVKADEKKNDGGMVLSMKVDTEQLSELESLRGDEVEEADPVAKASYVYPEITLLKEDKTPKKADASDEINENAQILRETLASFNIGVKDEILCSRGPTITRYELRPEVGVRVRSIANLIDDISLSLATSGVRIEAPIPNKPYVGIEVPNRNRQTVYLRSLIEDDKFVNDPSKLTACLGADVGGNPVFFDITKMPHLLIAGATVMGKSVCINCIIMSILYKASPEEVKLILIDPKKVEFNIYKDIPHLYAPIVSDPKKAAGALASAVAEMERRFELIEDVGVREINAYNQVTADDPDREYLPKMVIIIDELADLMMTAPGEVESSICRLAQKARAAGIHIIIGTQRPSVDVITGLIKANVPSRIACTVASQVDSRTIIDIAGAEKLIGRGDMLFAPVGLSKPMRVQGAFVSDNEVEAVVEFIKANNVKAEYNKEFISIMESEAAKCGNAGKKGGGSVEDGEAVDEGDPKFREAVKLAIDAGKISTSLMQRMLGVGYGRAAKIIDQMEALGYVSAPEGNKPRRVLITMQEYMEKVVNDDIEGDIDPDSGDEE